MARRFLLTTTVSLAFAAAPFLTPSIVRAEDQISPKIDTAPSSAIASINSDNVYIRSGAGDNYYPTAKVNTGTQVTVVGSKFDWLKIVPPEGSFCYVAKAFVDKNPDGNGTVNRDDVNVRAGSDLNAMKTTVQARLTKEQKVKILGEVDEYYKIPPPADAFVYVNKKFVDLVKKIPGAAVAQQDPATQTPLQPAQSTEAPATPVATEVTTPGEAATTQPSAPSMASNDIAKDATPAAATTQPASAEADFDKLEADFAAASSKPIEQQPLNELLASYNKLTPQLPESMRRIAEFRVQTLKIRAGAKDEFVAVQKQQQDATAKRQALKAEQEEIAQQIQKNDVKIYTAVGTLRTSSLQMGPTTLYRLTDPSTGRTVCYLRSDDAKYGQALGQFIGVKGQVATDPQLSLKVVTPTDWAPVDPNQLYRGVAAQIVPPSLVPQAQQASATNSPQQ